MARIVSLIASATEIVCALGLEDQLVGRSHECDFPESVKRLPVCTAPRFNVHGSSAEIDRRVKEALGDSASVYHVERELLRKLRPDVIVTQSQCAVCAVSLRDVQQAVCDWLDSRAVVVSLEPNSLADLWTDIARVAEACGAAERETELIGLLQRRMEAIAKRARSLPDRPSVACLEWIDPLMAAGNWMPELVELAGGVNLFGVAGKHAPGMTWEELRARDPDVIVAMPCGLDLERTRAEMKVLETRPGWSELRAVLCRRVYVTDGNQFFNRPGPRLVQSLEILAEILHPGAFVFGHEGTGWQRL
jgi:iron complex transport system substrate-binding protein